jgi:hypothetical protein
LAAATAAVIERRVDATTRVRRAGDVSKVLSEFRRSGLIRISDRSLTILDPAGFRRVAQMR